jgi:hypothetical protein
MFLFFFFFFFFVVLANVTSPNVDGISAQTSQANVVKGASCERVILVVYAQKKKSSKNAKYCLSCSRRTVVEPSEA